MVHTLVYLADRPIGMRRRLMPELQLQLTLLVSALMLLAALVGLRGLHLLTRRTAQVAASPVLAPSPRVARHVRHAGSVASVGSLAAPAHRLRHSAPSYRQEFALPPVYPYARAIKRVAAKYHLPADLVAGVVQIESQFNPRCLSPVGAEGLMQLMPDTGWLLAHKLGWHHYSLFNPEENLELGTYFLKSLIKEYGDVPTALSYYNAGRWGIVSRGVFRNGRYVHAVLEQYYQFRSVHRAQAHKVVRGSFGPPLPILLESFGPAAPIDASAGV